MTFRHLWPLHGFHTVRTRCLRHRQALHYRLRLSASREAWDPRLHCRRRFLKAEKMGALVLSIT